MRNSYKICPLEAIIFIVDYHYLFSDLLDPSADYDVPVDIFAIGFEEMVDLNASNIMSARFEL
jgi:phosphatidylinositol-bisphosphatase